jgi:hypothetical protein
MRMKTDDDVYRARVIFLGPKGFTLPFRLPFITYVTGAALLVVSVLVRLALTGGLGFPTWEICFTLLGTWAIHRSISPDRPVRAVLSTWVHGWRRAQLPAPRQERWRLRRGMASVRNES